MTQPTVSKHRRRVVSYPDSSQSHQAHRTMLRTTHSIHTTQYEQKNNQWQYLTIRCWQASTEC